MDLRRTRTRSSLLARLKDPADHDAWQEFDARYRALIVGYSRARGLQPADAEDVCQLVMLGLARVMPRFHYDGSKGRFRSYLGRCVRHAIERWNAGQRSHVGFEHELARLEVATVEADSEWQRQWVLHHYGRALVRIREQFDARSVRAFEALCDGFTVEQVARRTGASVQAVHKAKQRIRRRMQELIAAQIAEEEDHG